MTELAGGGNQEVRGHHYNEGIVSQLLKETEGQFISPSVVASSINGASYANDDRVPKYPEHQRGELPGTDLYEKYGVVKQWRHHDGNPYMFIYRYPHRKITYRGFSFPGLSHGQQIFAALDQKARSLFTDPEILASDTAVRDSASLIGAIITMTHAFLAGNGRTSRAVIDFYLRKYSQERLDESRLLQTQNKRRLDLAFQRMSYEALPQGYSPQSVLNGTDHNEQEIDIAIPLPQTHSQEEVRTFLRNYADTIIDHLTRFQPRLPSHSFEFFPKIKRGNAQDRFLTATQKLSDYLEGFIVR